MKTDRTSSRDGSSTHQFYGRDVDILDEIFHEKRSLVFGSMLLTSIKATNRFTRESKTARRIRVIYSIL